MKKDVIVVGGGVIGCSIALGLAQAGLKVAVIERGRAGCEASRAAAGMLSPQTEAPGPGPFFDLCLRSRSMYRDFAAQITELSGIDVQYRDEGSLCLILESEDERTVDDWVSWQTEAGLALERVSADDARKAEPALTRSVTGAVYIPEDHQVENRRLMDALETALRRVSVEMIEGEEVDSLIMDGSRVIGVVSGGARREAGAVIIAAGCWSGRLLERVGLSVEVVPARGQIVALKGEASLIRSIVHSSLCYLVPRRDGRILIGSTTEYVGYRKGVTAGAVNALLAGAIEMIPALEDFEIVETWSGLRPDTTDHLPVMGFSGIDNLLIATGHFRNGILLAPVTSALIAEVVIGGRTPEELRPFSMERFDSSHTRRQKETAVF
ncbi:MAG: glycine oxidase ThiO [Blastocatellia bacterium]|nr:glycine oxidase ThiO [Blastocatellia bacterium]